MTDAAFRAGMKQMAAVFPDRDEDESVKATRGQVYRKVLDHLTDEAWLFAVDEALRYERWFPAPAMLIDYADEYVPKNALPPSRSPEQIEEARETARQTLQAGVRTLQAELTARGLLPAGAGVSEACRGIAGQKRGIDQSERGIRLVQDTDERRAELARQAEEIQR